MPTSLYKQPRTCECGYTTNNTGNWSAHKKRCKMVKSDKDVLVEQMKQQLADKDRQLADTKEQLVAKDEQITAKDQQITAKDRQIEELIKAAKKPRVVNNTTNKYVVEQNVNLYGKESIDHISPEQIQALLADPVNAVPEFIKLKRRAPGGVNKNLRVPNQKRAIYQVVVPGDGDEKEWENKAKGEILEELYDVNSGHLEAEADEDTRVGSKFLNHQDKIKLSASGEDGGRRYKEQLDKIHCVVSG